MIVVSRLDGKELVVNAGHLLLVENTPDTVLVLTTGHRIMVRESRNEIIARVVQYRQQIGAPNGITGPQKKSSRLDEPSSGAEPPTEEAES